MTGPVALPNFSTLRFGLDDAGVALITLNRPATRNAFNAVMADELAAAYRWCDAHDEARVVVLTGTPPAFCAGADMARGADTLTVDTVTADTLTADTVTADTVTVDTVTVDTVTVDTRSAADRQPIDSRGLTMPAWQVRKPVIAAVNGHAVGIGLTLTFQCDVRIMALDATYGVVQVRRGVVGDAYSHWTLPRLVGHSAAAEILLGGATFDGRRALELGLCSRAVANDEVLGAALDLATYIALNCAPLSLALSKQILWSTWDREARGSDGRASAEVVADAESSAHAVTMRHPDAHEAMAAFLARRPPRFTGSVSRDLPPET